MSKRTARYGGMPGPYTKYKKIPHSYNQVPLHREHQGVFVNKENLERFEKRIGLYRIWDNLSKSFKARWGETSS